MANKDDSLNPDFESGMLAGFADGMLLIHRILTDTVKATAPTIPVVSAFLEGFADSMEKGMPTMLRDYHDAKGLSVSLEVTVTSKDRKWN